MSFTGIIASNNYAETGGGVYIKSDANTSVISMSQSKFSENSAIKGGGMYMKFINKTALDPNNPISWAMVD